jgi:hypothetical protein
MVAVTVAIAVLLWLLHRVGWSTIQHALSSVGWTGAGILVALAIAESCLDGAALWTIVRAGLPWRFAVVVNAAGALLNLVLPWDSGEVLKGSFLRKPLGSRDAIAGTIIWNYIFKISRPAVSALAALVGWAIGRHLVDRFTMGLILVANLAAFAPYIFLRLVIRFGAAGGLLRILRYIPGVRRHPAHWIELARNIDGQVRTFWRDRPADYLRVFVLQAFARSTGWLSIYAAFRLVGLPYGFPEATLMYATMNVAEYVIAVLPARIGVSEGTAFFAFKFLGLNPSLGVVVYVILRVRTILANGLLAPFVFLDWTSHLTPPSTSPPSIPPALRPEP